MIAIRRLKEMFRFLSISEVAARDAAIERGKYLVYFYYLTLPFLAYLFFENWHTPVLRQNFDALWPLVWSRWFALDLDTTVNIVRFGFLATSLVGVLLYTRWYGRAAVAFGIWQAHALDSSFGIITHQWYVWLFTALIFIVLPDAIWKEHASSERRRIFLLIIWWAQASVMLIYSLAGMWKFITAIEQMLIGEIHGFSPYALSYQIAWWIPQLQNAAPLGGFAISHPYVVWPLYLLVQYVQIFALWTMVRPALQKLWAGELVLFHIGTSAFMGIQFAQHIPLLLVLFFTSPFTPNGLTWKRILLDLPVIGQAAEYALSRSRRTLRTGT